MSKNKKTVIIKESELVNMINDIADKVINEEKQKTLLEQKNKEKHAIALLEEKISRMQKQINRLTESKK
jgi:hypothetical protein